MTYEALEPNPLQADVDALRARVAELEGELDRGKGVTFENIAYAINWIKQREKQDD